MEEQKDNKNRELIGQMVAMLTKMAQQKKIIGKWRAEAQACLFLKKLFIFFYLITRINKENLLILNISKQQQMNLVV